MAPIQVLTNNLLYDLSQSAIPTDRVDPEELRQPRRWEIGQIARFMFWMGPLSSVFDYVVFAVMFYGLGRRPPRRPRCFTPAGLSSRCCRRRW
jgi:Mg2+-importing ATPase